jgi:hypothetical protein
MGLLELFKGAVLAIRNVFHLKSRNHQENPYITIEYLQFASFLAKKLDLAKPVKENSDLDVNLIGISGTYNSFDKKSCKQSYMMKIIIKEG